MEADPNSSSRLGGFVPAFSFLIIAGAVIYSLLAPPLSAPSLDAHRGARAVVQGLVVEEVQVACGGILV
ncbi:MAG: hypothetical protein AAB923_03275, partial [Patescibacteria group bacterium]